MNVKAKMTLIGVATYLVQVATFWGILEGSLTFFAGDDLKAEARKYWALLYLVPLGSTYVYLKYFRARVASVSGGGVGGSAEVIGKGEARGGKGGSSGSFGPGGRGGDARVVGAGKATGGGGGNG